MAKKRVTCPDCGYRHTIMIDGARAVGVRYMRTTENQFQTKIDVPGEIVEGDRYWSLGDQFLGAALVGLLSGTMTGYFLSLPWHATDPLVAAQIIMGCAVSGPPVACAMLYKERAWNLGRALPAAARDYLTLSNKETAREAGPTLTVIHSQRDGHAEAGRTIQYFGELPVDVPRFNEWAQGVLMGKSLSVPTWTPKAKLFSRSEYDLLLNKMQAGETVINLGANKGNTLTGGGRRALALHLKQEGIAPLPHREESVQDGKNEG